MEICSVVPQTKYMDIIYPVCVHSAHFALRSHDNMNNVGYFFLAPCRRDTADPCDRGNVSKEQHMSSDGNNVLKYAAKCLQPAVRVCISKALL
jgi:hypothetical protein